MKFCHKAILFSLLSSVHCVSASAADSPNIVFILADDWGWTHHDHPGIAQGHQTDFFQTPNFSKLVDEGVAFTSAYAQPNCAPTRAALITGQYAPRSGNGVYNVDKLNRGNNSTQTTAANQGNDKINGNDQTITIGEAFQAAGYVTAHFGKYHVGSGQGGNATFPLNQGFDFNFGGSDKGAPGDYLAKDDETFSGNVGPELDPFAADYTSTYITNNLVPFKNGNDPTVLAGTNKHLTDALGDAFISFMNAHKAGAQSDSPVYVQLHFYAVHSPIKARADLKAKYDALTTISNRANYAALVEGMDQTLGRVLAYLDDPDGNGDDSDSIADNTLVIFCSDNGGTHASNLPLRGRKGMHYEGGIRIPTVVRMPGTIPAGKLTDTLTHVVDFYPTMLDFATGDNTGSAYPDNVGHPLDGVSLYNHLLDPDTVGS